MIELRQRQMESMKSTFRISRILVHQIKAVQPHLILRSFVHSFVRSLNRLSFVLLQLIQPQNTVPVDIERTAGRPRLRCIINVCKDPGGLHEGKRGMSLYFANK